MDIMFVVAGDRAESLKQDLLEAFAGILYSLGAVSYHHRRCELPLTRSNLTDIELKRTLQSSDIAENEASELAGYRASIKRLLDTKDLFLHGMVLWIKENRRPGTSASSLSQHSSLDRRSPAQKAVSMLKLLHEKTHELMSERMYVLKQNSQLFDTPDETSVMIRRYLATKGQQ